MANVSPTRNNEIDIFDLIEIVWNGKWRIAFIMSLSLLSTLGFNILNPNTNFTAITEIKPITNFEFDKYRSFNSSLKSLEKEEKNEESEKEEQSKVKKDDKDFLKFKITQEYLLNSYLEKIEEGSILESGISKYNLINKDDFENEDDFQDAVVKFASNIEIFRQNGKGIKKQPHYYLRVQYNDETKWKNLLTFVNDEANKAVKSSIINSFEMMISLQNQKKNFALKNIETKIDNALRDYDILMKNRLAFLAEQAAIAKILDIKKNYFPVNSINPQNSFVTIKSEPAFYLRGYLAIEKEINLIKNRKNKEKFVRNLHKLKQKKRDLNQDLTVQRSMDIFNKTPLNKTNFKATQVKIATTDFEYKMKNKLFYALALVLGGIIGVVYVLIVNTLQNRKNNMVSS